MRKSSYGSIINIKKYPNKKNISTSISLTRPTTQTQNKIVNLSLLNSYSKIKLNKKNMNLNNSFKINKTKTNSTSNLTKKIIIPYNSNEYWHLIDPKLHTNKIQLNWNFNLRVYPINNDNNNKKFVRSFSAPSFYEEDLNKYKNKINNKNNNLNKITDDDKNKNFANIKHLFKNNINGIYQTNNHFNFEVSLRNFNLKHSNSFINKKWKNFDGKKLNKEIVNLIPNQNIKENSILRPFNILKEKILFYNDPIIKKTYLKEKNLAYCFNYNHMNSLPFNDNFNERNYVKLKESFDKKNNLNEYIFQFGLRNNKVFK